MKKLFLSLFAVLFLSGCALIPKPVEFFQKKVAAFPEPSARMGEVQKQAAQRAKVAAQATFEDAIAENSSPVLRADARDAAVLTDAVSTSLGPPKKDAVGTSDEVARELRAQIAKLNAKIDAFQAQNEKVEGKKIEGTGFFQIPYFVYLAVVILIIVVGWHLLHTVITGLQVAGVANPAVGAAAGVAGAGLNEIEALFKKYLAKAAAVVSESTK